MDYKGTNNINGFYGNDKSIQNQDNEQNKFNKTMMILSSVIGLISLLILIALNITNLSVNIDRHLENSKNDDYIKNIMESTKSIIDSLSGNVNPRLNIITTATSYNLPTLISSQSRMIRNDIYQYCSPRYENPDAECPIVKNPRHEGQFSLYDTELALSCNDTTSVYRTMMGLDFIPFASFIPSPTTIRGCIRNPTFSLSDTIYSYSHSISHEACTDDTPTSQYWSIGKIVQGQNHTPIFKEMTNWYINDGKTRRNCATTASTNGAWLGCSLLEGSLSSDFFTQGISDIFLAYMDVFGRQKSWVIKSDRFPMDKNYDSLFFSLGSGMVLEGRVYFLMYGGLRDNNGGSAYCDGPECNSFDQNVCNKAQAPPSYNNKQTVSGLLSFDDSVATMPDLAYRTIPADQVTIGSRGRLYHFPYSNKTYIYLESASWHSLLQFGELIIGDNIRINWGDFTTFSRPAADPCSSANRCPKICLGGVYTDYFLLAEEEYLGISVILTGGKLMRGPQIRIGDKDHTYLTKNIVNQNQGAKTTTTTCFIYFHIPWCVSIVEMSPGAIGSEEPVTFMYPLWNTCIGEMTFWQNKDDEKE
ncbi:attachment glycoprotein [Wufeng Myotis altarium paramyxovirus 1]|uniref:Attachment glycoprotein n=1 Tax=Wufeng Myotis altarium paramyxovirus 1 TaxID=2928981 RepID=A0A8T9KMB1_9MONO|nr:attachment glycoprotein [Wufeng Myotis altarium paramyxovirus 1]